MLCLRLASVLLRLQSPSPPYDRDRTTQCGTTNFEENGVVLYRLDTMTWRE